MPLRVIGLSYKIFPEIEYPEIVIMDKDLSKRIKDENIKVHNIEAITYDALHSEIFNKYEQKKNEDDIKFIIEQISTKNPSALDIGCGTGNLSLMLLRYGFSVTGVDISKEMLNVLRSKTTNESIRLIESDIDNFLRKQMQKYDVICFSSVLHHLPDYLETLKNATNLLKDDSIIWIVHEPLPKNKEKTTIFRLLAVIDWILSRILLRLRNITPPTVDHTYTDYHVKKGLDFNALTKNFKV